MLAALPVQNRFGQLRPAKSGHRLLRMTCIIVNSEVCTLALLDTIPYSSNIRSNDGARVTETSAPEASSEQLFQANEVLALI